MGAGEVSEALGRAPWQERKQKEIDEQDGGLSPSAEITMVHLNKDIYLQNALGDRQIVSGYL